jgi:hypothetical protein
MAKDAPPPDQDATIRCADDEAGEIAEKWGLLPMGSTAPYPADELLEELARRVAVLLDRNRAAFLQSLYRLDVSEEKSRRVFAAVPPGEQPRALARLILQREIEKARTRKAYAASQQKASGNGQQD